MLLFEGGDQVGQLGVLGLDLFERDSGHGVLEMTK